MNHYNGRKILSFELHFFWSLNKGIEWYQKLNSEVRKGEM